MRVMVYVDGFNVYYRALSNTKYKWLDLSKLATSLLDQTDTIVGIKYYTARVSGRNDPDQPRRQQAYLNALKTLPNIHITFGSFINKEKRRPLVNPRRGQPRFVDVYDTEEKGSDVNLASHLIHDAWGNKYDVALVMSQDSDLQEPLRLVKYDLKKIVGLVWLDGQRPNIRMSQNASFVRNATAARLAAAQFPEVITRTGGKEIRKPSAW